MEEKPLVCKFIGYKIFGMVCIQPWGGGKGMIEMNPKLVNTEDEIRYAVNDGGFGCERMLYARVEVYKQYENGASNFFETRWINLVDENEPVTEKQKAELNKMFE